MSFAIHMLPPGFSPTGNLLGTASFNTPSPLAAPVSITLDLPPVATFGPAPVETWATDLPVSSSRAQGFSLAHTTEHLFGAISLTDENDLTACAENLYTRLFSLLETTGHPHLLRIYNYIPRILAPENKARETEERYRQFNTGRHAAFARFAHAHHAAPAASALGTQGEHVQLYFLAAKTPGLPLENPRQVSAYHYPDQYGKCPPIFARANLVGTPDAPLLLISGTASIVNHASQHEHDLQAQTLETLTNIDALISACRPHGYRPAEAPAYKIYCRPDIDPTAVQAALANRPATSKTWLTAEVCRKELLVEMEAVIPLKPYA